MSPSPAARLRGMASGLLTAALAVAAHGVLLSVALHDHMQWTAPPTAVMVLAHGVAIGVGAMLIAVGDRLCRAVTRVIQAAARVAVLPVATARRLGSRRTEEPLRSMLLLIASLSHRGPPVGLIR
jgi:hypothetical protein